MAKFLTLAIRPNMTGADREALRFALESAALVHSESKGAVGGWIEWLLEVKGVVDSVGGTAGALTATAALAQAVIKWRRRGSEDPSTAQRAVIVHAPGSEPLNLEAASDEEIIEWFRRL
ncbi:hypothetical protein ACFUEN_02200 [Streptomyces griseorubiginosus]|uniref:hypothetical protein n=1 Tax=Streptomyces griseorubiginosus TaxID=67304 RepID=UPI003642B603